MKWLMTKQRQLYFMDWYAVDVMSSDKFIVKVSLLSDWLGICNDDDFFVSLNLKPTPWSYFGEFIIYNIYKIKIMFYEA